MARAVHPLIRTLFSLFLYATVYYLLFKDIRSIGFLLAVIVIHELGHYIAMKRFGYTNMQMMFIPLVGGFVRGEPAHVDPVKKMTVLMAGPMPGIVLGMLAGFIYGQNGMVVYRDLALMFIFLNVFNLLPLTPMDGGQMLVTLFPEWARVIQTVFAVVVTIALVLAQSISSGPLPLFLMLVLWWRVFRILKRPVSEEETEGGRISPTALQQIMYVIIWLVFMVIPIASLIRLGKDYF